MSAPRTSRPAAAAARRRRPRPGLLGLLGLLGPGLLRLSLLELGLLRLGSPASASSGSAPPGLSGRGSCLLSPGLPGLGLLSLGLRRLTSILSLCRPTGFRRLIGLHRLTGLSLNCLNLAGGRGSILWLTTGVHLGLGHDNSFSPLFLAAPGAGTTGSTGPRPYPAPGAGRSSWRGVAPARAVTPVRGPAPADSAERPEHQLGEQVVQRGHDHDHHEHERQRDDRVRAQFPAGRPDNLAQFGNDLADEQRGTGPAALAGPPDFARFAGLAPRVCVGLSSPEQHWSGHSLIPTADAPTGCARRAGGTRTPNHRFWRPGLWQLSYCPCLTA